MTRLPLTSNLDAQAPLLKNGLIRRLQQFWRFSLYYGTYVATPIAKRGAIKSPRIQ